MFSLKDLQRLKDMREYAAEAHDLIQGKTRADLDRDRLLNLAVIAVLGQVRYAFIPEAPTSRKSTVLHQLKNRYIRLLEVVGEAASRISREDCTRYPEISWAEIVGLRNRLIHGYGQVDFDIVWQILTVDLSPLIENLDRIIAEQEETVPDA